MPLIYSFQRENNERSNISRRTLPRTFSRYNFDYQDFESRHDDTEAVIPLFQRRRHREFEIAVRSDNGSTASSSSSSSSSNNSSDQNSSDSSIIDDNTTDEDINQSINQSDIEEEEEEEGEQDDDDNTTITESFTRSRVDIYRLAIRTNSEILEDLAAIIRILRQINAIYRVFHNSNNSNRFHSRRPIRRRVRIPTLLHHNNDDDNNNIINQSDTDSSLEEEDEDDEEANKLLEAGLEDLQTVLTMENNDGIKRQSTLALLALITYQYNHCSDTYLRHYLDPNGDYNPALAVFAAATYDEEEAMLDQPPKSCQDIIIAAEELYGPDWLDEFHKGKEGALRKMLEKLTFVAQIRLKVRDISNSPITR
ncbi:hypothetical protein EDC94DRAFT_609671 [Helicostylum pulchrum]|nr:hypothetical protein EDC94DRAFT_609671 [Helicostylum pulchrum]